MKKIVIIGPESTGKSTLCEQLAQHYDTLWCPEFAREFLLTNGTSYTYDDLLSIAKGQLAMEDEFTAMVDGSPFTTQNSKLLFIDTDMYVMKVWCEFVFANCHRFILDQIVERKYDLYLLCNTDLPWVKDELREYPDLVSRQQLYHMYKDNMINQSVPWADISGSYEERLQKAVVAVDTLIMES
jgi:NadR type nicotinamide-nucleotide adenylyltransferase